MSSSTSSSDADAGWGAFLTTFLLALALGAVALGAAFAILDPYDSGRATFLHKPGVTLREPRLANASRGRDPAFDAAIFGNSHMEELKPERLDASTGLRFVSLIAPGSGPTEQLVFLDWFLRRHPQTPRALVIGIDDLWCGGRESLKPDRPFPFWLYGESTLDYLKGLFRTTTLANLPGRLGYLAGLRRRVAPDGFLDYEPIYLKGGYGDPVRRAERLARPLGTSSPNPDLAFPAADLLEAALKRLPASVAVVLVRPPAYVTANPQPGTPGATVDAACRAAYAGIAAGRPRTVMVDWRGDRPENRNPDSFFDHTHYRADLAAAVEAEIADALRRTASP